MPKTGVRRRVWNGIGAMLRGQIFIHDRLYFSEIVYGTILRGGIDFSIEEITWIKYTLDEFEVPIILCLPPWEVTWENMMDDIGAQQSIDKLREIYRVYQGMTQDPELLARPYDYTSEHDTVEDLITWIEPKLNDLRRRFGVTDGGRTDSASAGT